MHPTIWAVANLNPEQERLLKEAEATLGGGVLVALRAVPGRVSCGLIRWVLLGAVRRGRRRPPRCRGWQLLAKGAVHDRGARG